VEDREERLESDGPGGARGTNSSLSRFEEFSLAILLLRLSALSPVPPTDLLGICKRLNMFCKFANLFAVSSDLTLVVDIVERSPAFEKDVSCDSSIDMRETEEGSGKVGDVERARRVEGAAGGGGGGIAERSKLWCSFEIRLGRRESEVAVEVGAECEGGSGTVKDEGDAIGRLLVTDRGGGRLREDDFDTIG
jgi:hypothetical protein